tara:strand:- start:33 stop:332 length:300 start_codon:yes stop_codon:yes gene_type:complete
MTTLENVKDFIRTANREELSEIRTIFNTAFKIIKQGEKGQFKKGDMVTLDFYNYDPTVIYEVVRVNKRTLTITNEIFGTLKADPHVLKMATPGAFQKLK